MPATEEPGKGSPLKKLMEWCARNYVRYAIVLSFVVKAFVVLLYFNVITFHPERISGKPPINQPGGARKVDTEMLNRLKGQIERGDHDGSLPTWQLLLAMSVDTEESRPTMEAIDARLKRMGK